MNSTYPLTWTGFLITFLGAVLFSTKAVLVKLAFADSSIDAVTLLALRMLFALPFYLGALLFINRKNLPRLSRRQWMLTIITGLLGYYASSLLDFLGLQYISAGLERLILFLYPTFVVLINALFFRQPVRPLQRWALVITYAGLLVAYMGELDFHQDNQHFVLGSVLVFCCAVTYALFIVGSGRMIPQLGAGRFNALAMLAACAGVLVHFLLTRDIGLLYRDPQFIWYGLMLAVVATVVPSFLIAYGVKKAGANNVAIISSIGPVSTIAQAHYFLGEPIFWQQLAGTVLVVTGILLLSWKRSAA